MFDEQDLRVGERLATLETNQRVDRKEIGAHRKDLDDIKQKMTTLVLEVRQIRNALYVLAGAVAMNIPALSGLVEKLKLILF